MPADQAPLAAGDETVPASVTAGGERSVAAETISGTVATGDHANIQVDARQDHRRVELAPGVLQSPDGIAVPAAGVWYLPRPPSSVFVGRAGELDRLSKAFTPTPTPS